MLLSTVYHLLYSVLMLSSFLLQKEAPEEFGVLRFSHIYDEKDKLLKVVVLSASGIPALDKSGEWVFVKNYVIHC